MAYPVGTILGWDKETVPDGWALCNGQTVNTITTPDLRDKFIRGASDDTDCNTTGGASEHDHSYPSPATSADGEHNHSASPSVGNSGTPTKAPSSTGISRSGNHTHSVGAGLGTESDHTHDMPDTATATNIPAHIVLKFIMKVEE
jgi:hypothetical protein